MHELITLREAAKRLGVPYRRALRAVRAGRIVVVVRHEGERVRYLVSSDAFPALAEVAK